jgi:hypothetical protein
MFHLWEQEQCFCISVNLDWNDQQLLSQAHILTAEKNHSKLYQEAAAVFFRLKKFHELLREREFEPGMDNHYLMTIFSLISNVHTFGNFIFWLHIHYHTEQTDQIVNMNVLS